MAKITMVLDRETKGALRYAGQGEDSPEEPMYLIGTLYLRKAGVLHHLGVKQPSTITVTVEVSS